MGDTLNNILGIAASLLTILSPLINIIINGKKSDPGDSGINITTINNYNYNNRNGNNNSNNESLDNIIQDINKDYNDLKEYGEIVLLLAVALSLFNFLIAFSDYADLFIISEYIKNITNSGESKNPVAYLVAFLITFLGFFFTAYFASVYYYDFRLRGYLKNFGYLYQRPTLEKLQRILIKKHKYSHFSIYPIQTMARLIENSDIKSRNKRKTKSPHESLRFFWSNRFIIWAFISLLIIHFAFKMSNTPENNQFIYPKIQIH